MALTRLVSAHALSGNGWSSNSALMTVMRGQPGIKRVLSDQIAAVLGELQLLVAIVLSDAHALADYF